MRSLIILLSLFLSSSLAQFDPHWWESRSGMVHLFEWKWPDIAHECEDFLAPNGFAGVQVSPPTENTIIGSDWPTRPWWERYQPISYKLITRSGNEASFSDMIRRCNAVGVRIYVDLLLNHMSATTGYGTGGSFADVEERDYPEVPYGPDDFNAPCYIDWGKPETIRNCQLVGLPDLIQNREHVRMKQVELMNHLIDLGVAGFRVDAMKHMWADDLEVMFSRLNNLNTNHGFRAGSRAFIVGEVINGDGIWGGDYVHLGPVTEFRYSQNVGQYFRGHADIKNLHDFGENWFGLRSDQVLTFVDNHDNQRGGFPVTNYKEPRVYKMATAFHMAWPYGIPRLMSSFEFSGHDQGPPQDANQHLISPVAPDGSCTTGWVCEHRWPQITKMVQFRNVVKGTKVENWWDNGWNKIAFSRGNRGFIAFATHNEGFNERLQTGLPSGTYCDVASGGKVGSSCKGHSINVDGSGYAQIYWPGDNEDGFAAFNVDEKL